MNALKTKIEISKQERNLLRVHSMTQGISLQKMIGIILREYISRHMTN